MATADTASILAAREERNQETARLRALAERLGLEFVSLAECVVSPGAAQACDSAIARRCKVMPFRVSPDALWIATADPLDLPSLDLFQHQTGRTLRICVAERGEIEAAWDKHFGLASGGESVPAATAPPAAAAAARGEGAESPVVEQVETILRDAARRRASDIHFEPGEDGLRVRLRIDGSLVTAAQFPAASQRAILSRLKILAGLSIAEKRRPQDGRARLLLGSGSLDLRVSSIPALHGESIVVRLLPDPATRAIGLAELGLGPEDENALRSAIGSPDGMILVTGPTGSGKTTTLYSCVRELNGADRKIITVEDPVEYAMPGVNQVAVRSEIGMTFAAALRAMLRQSPNVIMVGEVRDPETAQIAVNAALTGHLVFSTLHTSDALGALPRLAELGVNPVLAGAAVRAVIAQRLVRRLCTQCRRPTEKGGDAWWLHFAGGRCNGPHWRAVGCVRCHGAGYLGRIGIFEIFLMSDEVRRLLPSRPSTGTLREMCRQTGHQHLASDAVRKVLAGLTTIEEVAAVFAGESDQTSALPFSHELRNE